MELHATVNHTVGALEDAIVFGERSGLEGLGEGSKDSPALLNERISSLVFSP